MVSGKPPRRSKSTGEPVTIDLTATPVNGPQSSEIDAEKSAKEANMTDVAAESAGVDNGTTEAASVSSSVSDHQPHEMQSHQTRAESVAPTETVGETATLTDTVPDARDAETVKEAIENEHTSAEDPKAEGTDDQGKGDVHFGSASSAFSPPPPDEPAPPSDASNSPPLDSNHRASSPAMSGLIAAGIVGGLVALLGAGALQYAGIVPSAGSGASKTATDQRLASLSAEIEQLKAGTAVNSAPADVSALEQRLAQLENRQQQPGVDPAAVSDLQAKLAGANQAIDQLKSELTGRTEKLTEGQTELTDKVGAIETKINRPRDDIEVARAIAASALKTAADRGGPFLAELRTLGSIVPEDTAVAALEPYATTGVTSRTELLRQFGPVADKILSTINAPAESANIGERLWASALSVVKVRPVGNVEGDSASAIVARIEDKIRNGDLKGAAAEWESLPEAGRNVSATFKKALDARITVENQVSDALARAVAGRQG